MPLFMHQYISKHVLGCIMALSLLVAYTPLAKTTTVSALKHSFTAKHDKRFFIGPIGSPYGFLERGIYKMKISNFIIQINDHNHTHKITKKNKKATLEEKVEILFNEAKGLHPGFLLKRFDSEGQFAKFQSSILDNPAQCGFGDLMHDLDEHTFEVDTRSHNVIRDSTHNNDPDSTSLVNDNDDTVARGPGVVDGGPEGIFLSMNNIKQWAPNTPGIEHTFTAEESGYYFLFYQICLNEDDSGSMNSEKNKKFLFKELISSFGLEFEYLNLDATGKMSYLTAGEMPLPHIYLYFSVSYAMMLCLWVGIMKNNFHSALGGARGANNERKTVFAIHHLMSAVLLLKTLSVFFESVRYHFIRVKGHAEFWSFLYYGLTFLKGTFLFTLILLLGSGWSFFKSFLTPKERRIIYIVFILQVIDNIAVMVLTHETMGEQLYNEWSAVLHLVDIVSCCAILIPIVWQVNTLEQSLENQSGDNVDGDDNCDSDGTDTENSGPCLKDKGSGTDLEASRIHEKLALFRFFYLTVVAYIYFTRIIVYLIASFLPYNHTWMGALINELGTMVFYVTIGFKFKPKAESEYSTLRQDEEIDKNTSSSKHQSIELGLVGTKAKNLKD